MIYISWAALYEGESDRAYFDLLIPRLMEQIVLTHGVGSATIPPSPAIRLRRGAPDEVARAACEARLAFELTFIHADVGGRAQEAHTHARPVRYCNAMTRMCDWPPRRCIAISPRREVEAWVLADPQAVVSALGYRWAPETLGLPSDPRQAERLPDPKAVLVNAMQQVRGRRRPLEATALFAAVAQRQVLETLRQSEPFAVFERDVHIGLADLRCVREAAALGH